VVLQNFLDLLKAEPGSCCDTHVTSSHDGIQDLGMNIVEARDVQEDEDPLLMSPVIKVELEVSPHRCYPHLIVVVRFECS
jgi:hypothetical protein